MSNPEISEAAKAKRNELVELVWRENEGTDLVEYAYNAFDRFIQTTSDAGKQWAALLKDSDPSVAEDIAQSLILPDPKDPLEEAFDAIHGSKVLEGETWSQVIARNLRAELAKRGGKITFD